MAILDRINRAISTVKSVLAVVGWLGLTGLLTGIAAAIGGTVWAMITGISAPLVIMAAFCTFTGAVYLSLAPMAYLALIRARDAPPRMRPDPEVWRHLSQFQIFEAGCLLADMEPSTSLANEPGSSNGFCRALCIEVNNGNMQRINMHYDDLNIVRGRYIADIETVISREELKKFAVSRGLKRAFLE